MKHVNNPGVGIGTLDNCASIQTSSECLRANPNGHTPSLDLLMVSRERQAH